MIDIACDQRFELRGRLRSCAQRVVDEQQTGIAHEVGRAITGVQARRALPGGVTGHEPVDAVGVRTLERGCASRLEVVQGPHDPARTEIQVEYGLAVVTAGIQRMDRPAELGRERSDQRVRDARLPPRHRIRYGCEASLS